MEEGRAIVLIPAYRPEAVLLELAEALARQGLRVLVVDDGSGEAYTALFQLVGRFGVVLRHEKNRGKGAAIKTGLAYLQAHCPAPFTVAVADADGQHRVGDTLRVLRAAQAHPDSLVLGSRAFTGSVPLRSRIGNRAASLLCRLSCGQALRDTQTGLRAFSSALLPRLCAVEGERYEYEMNVLLRLSRAGVPIQEVAIDTVYFPGNPSSHYRALRDSLRIVREVLRFSAASLLSFLLDYLLFAVLCAATGRLLLANLAARLVSACVNFTLNRRLVFRAETPLLPSAVRYAALAGLVLACNCALLQLLTRAGLGSMAAKLLTEMSLFTLSYLAQSRMIFRAKHKKPLLPARRRGEQKLKGA